jgi:trans-aconitate methyltransferase
MSQTTAYYDALAPIYDHATAGSAWTPNALLADDLGSLGLAPPQILDLGAGTGQTAATVAALYPQADITCVDFSREMLAVVPSKVPAAKLVKLDLVDYLRGTAQQFHLVLAIGCLEFVPNLRRVLPQLVSAVAHGGHLCFTYEPQIVGLPSQSARRSSTTARREGVMVSDFRTYRHGIAEVDETLTRGALIEHDQLFVAYRRSGQAVIYRYIRVRSSER